MVNVTWVTSTSGDWLTGTDWSTGSQPDHTETVVSKQPTDYDTSAYTVTVGADDSVNVKTINISTASATPAYLELLIAGSLTVETLTYGTSVEATPIKVRNGGLLDITGSITDVSFIPETTTDADTVVLSSLAVYSPYVAIDFSNTTPGVLQHAAGYTAGIAAAQVIENAASHDNIAFADANFTGELATYSGTELTIKNGSTTELTFDNVYGPADTTFALAGDTIAVDCCAAGTRILTAAGERRVENLRAGDLMMVVSGEERIPQPIKWVGRRQIDLTTHQRPETVAPIRIKRGAFADNVPHWDLRVSPDHAIFVDGKLICARQLVNGMTIWQENNIDFVEYFHVELDAHAIVLAEGLPVESYLNTGNDGFFSNPDVPMILHPDLNSKTAYPSREAASAAPFVWDEESIRPIWQTLADRAGELRLATSNLDLTDDPDLHIVADGRRHHGGSQPEWTACLSASAECRHGEDCLAHEFPAGGQALAGDPVFCWCLHAADPGPRR